MSHFSLNLGFLLFFSWILNQTSLAHQHDRRDSGVDQPNVFEILEREKLLREDCAWAWEQLEVEQAKRFLAQAKKQPGEGISIAHIDTGILPFPALQRNHSKRLATAPSDTLQSSSLLSGTFNFVQLNLPAIDNNPKAPNFGHGTETASLIIGSLAENNVVNWAFHGVSPAAQIIPIKVTDSVVMLGNVATSGTADLRNLAQGIRLATRLGAHIMTISLGALFDGDNLIAKAVQEALDSGTIVVAAAGQVVPIDLVPLPASLPGVVSVTASTREREHWQYAFSGKNISWAAPGENVCHFSMNKNATYDLHPSLSNQIVELATRDGASMTLRGLIRKSSGTSYSTAFTAGAAALWLQHHSWEKLSKLYGQKNISRLFISVAQSYGMDRPEKWNVRRHGAGILNIRKLLEAPLPCNEQDSFESCSVKFSDFLSSTSR